MTTITTLPRVFILGALRIEDKAPHLPLADAVRILSKSYPQFRHSKIYEEDGVIKNEVLEYTIPLQPAKSNG
jgi:hypothetical protein